MARPKGSAPLNTILMERGNWENPTSTGVYDSRTATHGIQPWSCTGGSRQRTVRTMGSGCRVA